MQKPRVNRISLQNMLSYRDLPQFKEDSLALPPTLPSLTAAPDHPPSAEEKFQAPEIKTQITPIDHQKVKNSFEVVEQKDGSLNKTKEDALQIEVEILNSSQIENQKNSIPRNSSNIVSEKENSIENSNFSQNKETASNERNMNLFLSPSLRELLTIEDPNQRLAQIKIEAPQLTPSEFSDKKKKLKAEMDDIAFSIQRNLQDLQRMEQKHLVLPRENSKIRLSLQNNSSQKSETKDRFSERNEANSNSSQPITFNLPIKTTEVQKQPEPSYIQQPEERNFFDEEIEQQPVNHFNEQEIEYPQYSIDPPENYFPSNDNLIQIEIEEIRIKATHFLPKHEPICCEFISSEVEKLMGHRRKKSNMSVGIKIGERQKSVSFAKEVDEVVVPRYIQPKVRQVISRPPAHLANAKAYPANFN